MSSQQFNIKLLEGTLFKQIKTDFITSFYYYMVDSKYRIMKRLDKTLGEQPITPLVIDTAEQFWKYKNDSDAKIINILRWVTKHIYYKRDIDAFGKTEYWANANNVLETLYDDCDGMNSLILILGIVAGIPSEQLLSVIGYVANPNMPEGKEGHYWILYFSTKTGKWYVIDSTYYPDYTLISNRKPFDFSDKRYKDIWYIFNSNNICMKPIK